MGWRPKLLERWLDSRWFRIEMRIWGTLSLLVSALLVYVLWLDLFTPQQLN